MIAQYGDTLARLLAQRSHAPVANTAALQALGAGERTDGMLVVLGLGAVSQQLWTYVDASTAGADATHVIPTDAPATGRWHALSALVA